MSQGWAHAGTVDLAAPQRREEAASLVGLRVAKQAELDAVVRQSADLSERVRLNVSVQVQNLNNRVRQRPALTECTGAQLAALVERCAGTEAAAARAEQVASAAMAAAEGAVRDEMEAAAVAKETASALDKALTDLQVCTCLGCCRLLGRVRRLHSQSVEGRRSAQSGGVLSKRSVMMDGMCSMGAAWCWVVHSSVSWAPLIL